MKDVYFEITLASPQPPDGAHRFAAELDRVCDRFVSWPEPASSVWHRLKRFGYLFSSLPVSVASDRSIEARRILGDELARQPDVAVFDFAHSGVLAPRNLSMPTALFTHNVEAEIFARHVSVARHWMMRRLWQNQHRKMERYERETLARFDRIIAVSDRDATYFRDRWGLEGVAVIPTGVDLEYFQYAPPPDTRRLVFTGSMDWSANIDAIEFLMNDIWPRIVQAVPQASLAVVGRNPPPALLARVQERRLPWTFSGYVNDVRPWVHEASVYVIPLRVGGGTRIKAFEAMALGCPVVSTSIGVEGLHLDNGRHYLCADTAEDFANAVISLLRDPARRLQLAQAARLHVADNFSYRLAATRFADICSEAMHTGRVSQPKGPVNPVNNG
jgi:glycosyltransferase involved in cell wall biosynthesis